MRRSLCLTIALLSTLIVTTLGQDVFFEDKTAPQDPGTQQAGQPRDVCPVCGRKMAPDWRFCPYDGIELTAPEQLPERSPKEVLWCFFEGLRTGDKKLLAQSLALDLILEALIRNGIQQIDGLPSNLRILCARRLPGPAARAMVPAMLDVLASNEARLLQIPENGISIEELIAFYRVSFPDEKTAELSPTGDLPHAGNTFRLKMINGIWRIVSFPEPTTGG